LAYGYWWHVDRDLLSLDVERVDVGAFVDGPELDGTPTISEAGSASYEGDAAGLYAYRYGSSDSEIPAGSFLFGVYRADSELSADFDEMTVDGCIGCGRSAELIGNLESQDGSTMEFEDEVTVDVRLASAPIHSDGTFVSTGIDVQAFDGQNIESSSGSWGGKFSTLSVAGMPRLVAGTTGVNWTASDGGSGSLVGAFAATQR